MSLTLPFNSANSAWRAQTPQWNTMNTANSVFGIPKLRIMESLESLVFLAKKTGKIHGSLRSRECTGAVPLTLSHSDLAMEMDKDIAAVSIWRKICMQNICISLHANTSFHIYINLGGILTVRLFSLSSPTLLWTRSLILIGGSGELHTDTHPFPSISSLSHPSYMYLSLLLLGLKIHIRILHLCSYTLTCFATHPTSLDELKALLFCFGI